MAALNPPCDRSRHHPFLTTPRRHPVPRPDADTAEESS
ncbi:hypothetical protein [Azospirillum endophyticum]